MQNSTKDTALHWAPNSWSKSRIIGCSEAWHYNAETRGRDFCNALQCKDRHYCALQCNAETETETRLLSGHPLQALNSKCLKVWNNGEITCLSPVWQCQPARGIAVSAQWLSVALSATEVSVSVSVCHQEKLHTCYVALFATMVCVCVCVERRELAHVLCGIVCY